MYSKVPSTAASLADSSDSSAEPSERLLPLPPSSPPASHCCGLNAPDSIEAALSSRVTDAWWYQASCFSYCAAGGLLLLHPEPLERHMPNFPWRCMGLSVFANGFFSYMADVETWGRPSSWKSADRFLATFNSLLQIGIVVACCLGVPTTPFPRESVGLLGAGVAVALVCKQRGSAAFRRGDFEAYVVWHSLWHYILPAAAVGAQLILHRRCDWRFGASCACE